MTTYAITLVLLSAIIHTAWSLLAKRSPKTAGFYTVAIAVGLAVYAPVCVPHIAANPAILRAWPLFVISGTLLSVYYVLMYRTYRSADISLAYPLLRVSPIFSTIWAVLLLHEELTTLALLGIVGTVAGCIILPQRSLRPSRQIIRLGHYANKTYAMAITASLATSIYIVLDKLAMTRFNAAGGCRVAIDYVFLEMCVCGAGLAIYAAFSREPEFRALTLASLAPIIAIGPMLIGAYFLIVIAMAQPEVKAAYVSAFRLVSVVMTVIAGILLLKERFGSVRIAAAIVIVAGLMMIALGSRKDEEEEGDDALRKNHCSALVCSCPSSSHPLASASPLPDWPLLTDWKGWREWTGSAGSSGKKN